MTYSLKLAVGSKEFLHRISSCRRGLPPYQPTSLPTSKTSCEATYLHLESWHNQQLQVPSPKTPPVSLWPDLITTTLIIEQIVHLQLAVGFRVSEELFFQKVRRKWRNIQKAKPSPGNCLFYVASFSELVDPYEQSHFPWWIQFVMCHCRFSQSPVSRWS